MRGEYGMAVPTGARKAELPPHARRILLDAHRVTPIKGTTSACAENTRVRCGRCPYEGNYLRMRGEYRIIELY